MRTNRIRSLYTMCILILFLGIIPKSSFAATNQVGGIPIKGIITDNLGDALPGVSVVVKGTTIGTSTGVNGDYVINVPNKQAILVFSYLGFKTQEVPVGEKSTIDIKLDDTSNDLDEVVVVGYGVQKKVNLTGAVSNIDSKKIENRPSTNMISTLAGQAPGVRISQNSGNPGSEDVKIVIRGQGSINGGDPLVLIDGIQGTLGNLNSDDVESISILKDAASASIYGSRAANGVILVTTKKGRKQAPQVTFSAMFGSSKARTGMKFLSNSADWMTLHNTAVNNATPNATPRYEDTAIQEWRAADANPNGIYTDAVTGNQVPNWLAYPNTDWANEMFKASFYQRYNLSVSGGNENSSYLLSGGYQSNPGALENTGLERINIRANVETKVKDFLTIGTQTYGVKEFKDPGSVSMTYLFQGAPMIYPKYNGLYGTSELPSLTGVNNILASVANNNGQIEKTTISTNWYAIAKIWDNLVAEGRFNYTEFQQQENTQTKYLPQYRFRESFTTPAVPMGSLDQTSTTSRYSYFTRAYTVNFLLRYHKTVGDHDFSGFAAYEQYYKMLSGFRLRVKGMFDWNVPDINAGSSMDSWGTDTQKKNDMPKRELGILSYFGRINYAYKSRYLFEVNLRSDGSSRFAPGKKWGTFPSFSGAWRISEEDFFAPLKDKVENLKLKASYGVLGNQVGGYYDWQQIYGKTNLVLNESVQTGIVQTQIPNYDLTWEKTATFNVGFEASLLNQRLGVEFDYFTRRTTDMLVRPPLYLSLGTVTSPMFNSAEMKNTGFDVNVSWRDKIGKVTYSVAANAGYATNKVTKYSGSLTYELDSSAKDIWGNDTWRYTNLDKVSTVPTKNARIVEDHMINEYYLRKPYKGDQSYYLADGTVNPNGGPSTGIIRTKADLDWVRDMIKAGYSFNNKTVGKGAANLWYGEQLMADLNGDGRYGTDDDREFTGKSNLPKWVFGFNISAEWNGFDMSMSWSGRLGSYAYIEERGVNSSVLTNQKDALPSDAMSAYYSYDATKAASDPNYDPATDPTANISGRYPRLLSATSTMLANTNYLYNTSFLKLKSLQIGYTFPKKLVNSFGIGQLRVFGTVENLLTIKSKNFPGVDPELDHNLNVYPMARTFSGGLTLTF